MDASSSPDGYTTRGTLLLRLKTDDTQGRELAWAEFRARYGPVIAGFARKLNVRQQDIDDCIQDVLLGFYSVSPKFVYDPGKGRFRGYLKVCTFRAVRQRAGKIVLYKAVPLEQIADEDAEIDHLWRDVWAQEQLNRAIADVRDAYENNNTYQAFARYVIDAEPAERVAAELGMTSNSVYKAKERIAQAVRARLEALEHEEG